MHGIEQARIRRAQDVSVVNFFKNLIVEKDKFTGMRIISQDKIDDVLDKIQEIASANNMEVTIGASLEADTQDKGDHPYARKIFSLQASGHFKDMGVFLTALRDLPDAILDIESIHILSDKKDMADLQAQIIFVIFTTKDNENK
jgi:Tfp pilus assembly protein PilO